jgi:hypothetical protein
VGVPGKGRPTSPLSRDIKKVGLEAIIVFLNPGEIKSVMPEENFCIRVTVGAKKVFF